MNTPAHVVFSLSLLGSHNAAKYTFAVVLGALLPDALMILFYGYQKLLGVPESVIWTEKYFLPHWQNSFDLTNSIPLTLILLLVCLSRGWRWGAVLFASMTIHCLFDLPVHHDDGHRHFYPFSDFRLRSPLSYWDPEHYGNIVAMVEVILVIMGAVYLWTLERHTLKSTISLSRLRTVVLVVLAVYSAFFVFVAQMWLKGA